MNSRMKLAGGAAMLVLAMASANAVYAQETTSTVAGRVTANGAPVSGASITVVHTPSGTRSTTVSTADGGFSSRGLRVGGPYTVTVAAPGMPAKTFEGLFLNVGEVFNLDAEVAVDEVAAVEVVAAAARTEQGPSTVLSRDTLTSVVTIERDIRDVARRDPLVSQNIRGDGGISIAGSNPRTNRITIDGVTAQDPYGLETGGLPTRRGPISIDAVDQFSVVAVPTDVENGNFSGGALNIILRSGTNSFHGSAFVNYLNEGLVGKHIGAQRVPQLITQENWGAFLGGPIWRDKLFFALSYETYTSSVNQSTGPAGEGFANSFLNGLDRATVDQIRNIYNNNYASDYPIGDIVRSSAITDKKYSAKFDWNITDQHRASLTYRVSESSNLAGGSTQTVASLFSNQYFATYKDVGTTIEVNSDWTDKFSTVFRATYRDWDKGQNPPGGQNFSEVGICARQNSGPTPAVTCPNTVSQLRFGPDINRHANQLNIEEAQFQLTGTYQLTANRLKFGVQANHKDVYNVFIPNARGTYYFDSVADFVAGRANRLVYQDASSGNTPDGAALFDYWVFSGYFQDTLDITPDLSVTAGFRYDRLLMDQVPVTNPNFVNRNGFSNAYTLDGFDIVMPRVSVEWTTPIEGLKVNLGGGRFSGGYPEVLFATPFYNTGFQTSSIDIQRQTNGTFNELSNTPGFTQAIGATALNGLNTDPRFGLAIPDAVRQLQQGRLSPSGAVIPPLNTTIALSPSFELPSEWRAYLQAEYTVFDGWRLGFDYIAGVTQNAITYRDYRAQPLVVNGVRATTPDGRLRYDALTANAAQRAALGISSVSPASNSPNQDLVAENVDKGDNWIAAVSLGKGFDFGAYGGFDFNASYARQRANEVNSGLRFGTTNSSLYQNVPAGFDPAYDAFGRSLEEIQDRFKLELGYRAKFFGDSETRVTLFGERYSGRPFGFSMNDTQPSNRNSVFGVARYNHLLYVPDIAGDTNTSDLNVGLVTFSDAANRDRFLGYVKQFGLGNNQILEKNSNTNKDISRIDMQISQELPSLIDGHKFRLQFDIRNVLNLIDRDWGKVREYGTGSSGGGGEILARARCADANGAPVTAASPVCTRYYYSDVPNQVAPLTNNQMSLWAMQISLRYEF